MAAYAATVTEDSRPPLGAIQVASAVLVAATVLHDLDHVRQGRPLPRPVVGLGVAGLMAVSVACALALSRNRFAPAACAVVGFGTSIGVLAVHALPKWSALSDSYPDAGVDALAWLSVALMVVAATALAAASTATMLRWRSATGPPSG